MVKIAVFVVEISEEDWRKANDTSLANIASMLDDEICRAVAVTAETYAVKLTTTEA